MGSAHVVALLIFGFELHKLVAIRAPSRGLFLRMSLADFLASFFCVGFRRQRMRVRVAEQADATIAELRAWMAREHGVTVSHPVMWVTLRRLGLTFKKSPTGRPSKTARTWPPGGTGGRPR